VQVDLFFFCVMVGNIMARRSSTAVSIDVTAITVAARRVISPGTLVFLGRAR
jgi:hypothetical protein